MVRKTKEVRLALDYIYSFLKTHESLGRESDLFAYAIDNEAYGQRDDPTVPTVKSIENAIEWIGQQTEG